MNATLLHKSQYVTNSSNLKKVVGCKFLHGEDQEVLGYKILRRKDTVTSCRENKALGHFLHVFSMCSTCMMAFKISLIYV